MMLRDMWIRRGVSGRTPGLPGTIWSGPNLVLVWDPSRWHMVNLCRLSKCLVMKALRSLVVAVLHGLDDPEVIKTVRTAVPTVMGGCEKDTVALTQGGADVSSSTLGVTGLNGGDDDDNKRQGLGFEVGVNEMAKSDGLAGKRPAATWRRLETELEVTPDPRGAWGGDRSN
ncbi:hypothetical protein [Oryza sativa Japonica Group]|uniref:Uncharacterized protein n=1 Tax=Oryza sativa subsp. japonica TaxID=39947 RepID=Q5N7U1_ORYSJ|nr:hypothetical protein [Oryza sativa Japonica Group]